MDPVTIFSLVCGVIQVVDFSAKVLSTAKELYDKGSLVEYEDVEFMSEQLMNLRSDMISRRHESSGLPEEPGRKATLDLAGKCSQTALELHDQLEKLKAANRGSKREAIKKSFKTLWIKKDLERLEKVLGSYQRALNTNILVNLNQDFATLAAKQNDDFRNLDKSLLDLLAHDKLTFERIATYIDRTSQSTQEHISKEFVKLRLDTARDKNRQEFLASLHFPEIQSRQEGIEDAYKQTFQWIFDRSDDALRPWSNFMNWLEEGTGFYWINGKAGSGKSTLMNYIQSDPRTFRALQAWAGQNQLIVPVFFFWAAGKELQKSICGLLRSIIYQILEENPDIIDHIIEQGDVGRALGDKYLSTAWTERKLGQCFSKLYSKLSPSYRLCLFIDGLDEFAGDHHMLIDLLEKVIPNADMKCCVSSRPEIPFNRFKDFPMLKLQDLTRSDIQTFASSSISQHARNEQLSAKISEKIVEKADGVFLWAKLVVKDVVKGLRNNDDEGILLKRLESLPPQIDGLYSDMLNRIDKVYCIEAANYIQLTRLLSDDSLSSVFNFSILLNAFDDQMHLKRLRTDAQFIIGQCHSIKERIEIVCGGFLDLHDADVSGRGSGELEWLAWQPEESRLSNTSFDWSRLQVEFSHRTARDFFESNEAGIKLMQANRIPTTNATRLRLAIALARMSMCQHEESRDYMHENLFAALDDSFRETFSSQPEGFEALDYFNQGIADLDLELNGPESRGFWFHRWGPRHGDQRYKAFCRYSFANATSDVVWPEDKSLPGWFPMSFLGVAVFFRLYNYVRFKIQECTSDIAKEEVIQLMACVTDCTSIDDRENFWLEADSGFECIVELLSLGARFGIRPPGKLWELFWLLIVEIKVDIWVHGNLPDLEEAIGLFLESGAEPFPNLLLEAMIAVGEGTNECSLIVPFEVDTALLPHIYTIFGDIQNQKWSGNVLEQPDMSKEKRSKIDILCGSILGESFILREILLTDDDTQSLHRSLGALLVPTDEEKFGTARYKLGQTLVSICQHYARLQGREWSQTVDPLILGMRFARPIDDFENDSEDDSEGESEDNFEDDSKDDS